MALNLVSIANGSARAVRMSRAMASIAPTLPSHAKSIVRVGVMLAIALDILDIDLHPYPPNTLRFLLRRQFRIDQIEIDTLGCANGT
jgi:hypothetical protein